MAISIPPLRIGSFEINILTPSGWVYDTDHSIAVNYGFFNLVGGGVGGGRLTVRQTRTRLPNSGQRYRMAYTQVQVAYGTPWPIPITAGGGLEAFPAAAMGPVFRLPGSPDNSGEGGRPTGFEGTFNMVTLEGVIGAGYGVTALLMGANTILGMEVPRSFKYITFFRGFSANSAVISASVTGARGTFFAAEERN